MSRLYRGKIVYAHEDEGEFGREWFTVTVEDDGSRTLRCLCQMDPVRLTRDVTCSVDASFRPRDCFVRVVNEAEFVGSGWFRFSDDHVEGEIVTAKEGRISQKFATPGRANLFGTHPICIDIWKCVHVEADKPGETQKLENCFSSSLAVNGASGPMLTPKTYDLTFRGRDKVSVGAGTFDCVHFDWDTGTGRTLNLYAQPGDWLPIKTVVPERRRYYELVEYEVLR
jgi:hypothetical protein